MTTSGVPLWRRSAPLSGVLLAAALYTAACPPYERWVAAWAVPGLLFLAAAGLGPRKAFGAGVLFAFVIGYGITYWAPDATLKYFDAGPWAAWAFALAVWFAYGGLTYGPLLFAYAVLHDRVSSGLRPLVGACLWAGAELLRSRLFTGMPWELLGHTQYSNLVLIQIADLGGVYAVSFVVAFTSLSLVEVFTGSNRGRWRSRALRHVAPAVGLLVFTVAYGRHCARFRMAETAALPSGRTVAVVGADVPNAWRWDPARLRRVVDRYGNLTTIALARSPDLVVWPENAVSFYLDREPALREELGGLVAPVSGALLTGAPRSDGGNRAYNSAYLLGPGGTILDTYDKRRLVPFAEYNPFWRRRSRDGQPAEFAPGGSARPLRWNGVLLGVSICYEILFPHLVRDSVRQGAELLVNISNDSWMDSGDGGASRQHFSMAVFRAVETRRYLVRASSGGISGFVTPYGEIRSLLRPDGPGVAVGKVEPRRDLTVYVRWGDAWLLLALAGLLPGASWPGLRGTA
ncbi:MAG: apolipoprotein N-acyltransferase [Candidatus Binatia bacterium]|nr:MAG: apolipoprotein N-acyltransferase [Candidatus Binatia bacterium]